MANALQSFIQSLSGPAKTLATWPWIRIFFLTLMFSPMVMLAYLALQASASQGLALMPSTLAIYIRNSLTLAILAALIATLIGGSCAAIVGFYSFPGRRIISGLLLLPLAFPAYIAAFAYTDLLDFAGPIQSLLRDICGWRSPRQYWFPEIRTLPMAALLMALVLYPYVYMITLVAIRQSSQAILDIARLMEHQPVRRLTHLLLPVTFPALGAGASLVAMEALSDFGVVSFFGVPVLTTGIYDVWINRSSLGAAAQLSVGLLVFVALMMVAEQRLVKSKGFASKAASALDHRLKVSRLYLPLVYGLLFLPLLLGFLVPLGHLLSLSFTEANWRWSSELSLALSNSLWLSGLAAAVLTVISFLFVSSKRLNYDFRLATLDRVANMGYAVPGVILAIGLLIVLAHLDRMLAPMLEFAFGLEPRLWLSGSLFALIAAYCIRFFAPAYRSIDAANQRIGLSVDMAAKTLGRSNGAVVAQVHIPLLAPAALVAAMLVFVDTMKELPATLLLQGFGQTTLATWVFDRASDEMFESAAIGALLIVLIGCLPVAILARTNR